MRWFLTLLWVLCSCASEGQLTIQLESPKIKSFDPLQDVRLSRFSLRVIQGTSQNDTEALRTEGGAELHVGDVPVDSAFDLRLAGKSGTGQMLGLGLVFDLKVSAEGVLVAVKFRKPIGLIPGKHGVVQLDTTGTKEATIDLKPPIDAPGAVDVATSPDGSWFVVIAGSELQVYNTFDRTRWKTPPVRFTAPGTCVAVSPDSRYVVVCHDPDRVSIVDMGRLAEGKVERWEAPVLGKPTRVVFGRDRLMARVLVDGGGGCSQHSKLVEVDLKGGATREVPLGRAASDLAVDPRDGRVLLALPCEKRLGRLSNAGTQVEDTKAPVPDGVHDIALTDQYIVLFGTRKTTNGVLQGEATLIDLARGGYTTQSKPFFLPLAMVWSNNTGYWLVRESSIIDDVVVSPDGQRALALYTEKLRTIPSPNCPAPTTLDVRGYMLVDLTVEMLLHWQMTSLSFGGSTSKVCEDWIRQSLQGDGTLANPEYHPKGAAMLFGGS